MGEQNNQPFTFTGKTVHFYFTQQNNIKQEDSRYYVLQLTNVPVKNIVISKLAKKEITLIKF
jgi:hypothetical protein